MNLQQLIYFREVASTLHFTKAAENLYISQSTLSHAINSLERELDAPLFSRQIGTIVFLTKYGEEFLPYVNTILQSIEDGKASVKKLRDPYSGVVRFAYGFINAFEIVSNVFRQYYLENPDSNISIQFIINNGRKPLEDLLIANEVDLAFTTTIPQGNKVFEHVPLYTQQLFVYLPKDHPLARRSFLHVDDIKEQPLLLYNQGGNLANHVCEMFTSRGYRPNILRYVGDWMEQFMLVCIGMGITVSPMIPLNGMNLAVLPLAEKDAQRELFLYWLKDSMMSTAVQFIRDYFIEHIPK